ncbi:hypothetical protein N7494_007197 [Penicillium frequentans]|uniref:Uncharacterized protein n=1 Tax=Penicillium frequentans TaxID=3151616 RepID=A0AAD6GCK3_9EURO|nr:hypothetical protein N7494_007197 [Penicillium glabrum]
MDAVQSLASVAVPWRPFPPLTAHAVRSDLSPPHDTKHAVFSSETISPGKMHKGNVFQTARTGRT